jgi:hypothetical protein
LSRFKSMDKLREFDNRPPEFDFLRTEILTGFTFYRIALHSTDPLKKSRNQVNARKAYDSVLHFLPLSKLTSDEAAEMESQMKHLKVSLEALGETF